MQQRRRLLCNLRAPGALTPLPAPLRHPDQLRRLQHTEYGPEQRPLTERRDCADPPSGPWVGWSAQAHPVPTTRDRVGKVRLQLGVILFPPPQERGPECSATPRGQYSRLIDAISQISQSCNNLICHRWMAYRQRMAPSTAPSIHPLGWPCTRAITQSRNHRALTADLLVTHLLNEVSSTCTLTANPISWTTWPMTHLKEAFGPASLGCDQIEVCDGKQMA